MKFSQLSSNPQLFSELITTQLRVVFTLLIFLTMQSYKFLYPCSYSRAFQDDQWPLLFPSIVSFYCSHCVWTFWSNLYWFCTWRPSKDLWKQRTGDRGPIAPYCYKSSVSLQCSVTAQPDPSNLKLDLVFLQQWSKEPLYNLLNRFYCKWQTSDFAVVYHMWWPRN